MSAMHCRRMIPLALALALASVALANDAGSSADDCLFANTSGGTVVAPCLEGDPLKLGEDPRLDRAMSALGIAPDEVVFLGCSNVKFRTRPDPSAQVNARYLVIYPIEIGNEYLAPAVHELAHVMQIKAAGGTIDALRDARDRKSLRIELEADYLAGLVFRQALKGEGVEAFQQNLVLVGMFKEKTYEAHGTPGQRTGAFRMGYYLTLNEDLPDLQAAALHFQANEYAHIERAR